MPDKISFIFNFTFNNPVILPAKNPPIIAITKDTIGYPVDQ